MSSPYLHFLTAYLLVTLVSSPRSQARDEWVDWSVGSSGILAARDLKGLRFRVNQIDPGSAAEGRIQVGDFIVGASGKRFSLDPFRSYPKGVRQWFEDRAPSNELGEALVRASKNDGQLSLLIEREGTTSEVTLQLPITIPFSPSFPWDCERSDRLLEGILKEELRGNKPGSNIKTSILGLALMGADPEGYRQEIDRLAKRVTKTLDSSMSGSQGVYRGSPGSWVTSYQALFLGEYFMKYGNPPWLRPHLEYLMDRLDDAMLPLGYGWGHGYSEGDYRKFYGVWIPATCGCLLAIQCLSDAGIEVDPIAMEKRFSALEGGIDRENGEVGYQGNSLNRGGFDLRKILAETSYAGESAGNFASMYRQAMTGLALQKAGRTESLAAVAHMLGRRRIVPGTGHGCGADFHGSTGSIAACSMLPSAQAREFLDNWRFRLELASRADGGFHINPKKTTDFHGVAADVGRPLVALMLTMPRKELWLFSNVQDPSLERAPLVPERKPRSFSSVSPTLLTKMGNHLFFAGEDGTKAGRGLWRKSLSSGKVELVKGGFHKRPFSVSAIGGRVFFSADINESNDRELWITDGTAAGSRRLKSIGAAQFTLFDGVLYFAEAPKTEGRDKAFWMTDGTPEGTRRVLEKLPWPGNHKTDVRTNLVAKAIGKLFIAGGVDGGDGPLWVSDGSGEGTIPLADINALRHRHWGVEFRDRFYFISSEKANTQRIGLWSTGGTLATTKRVSQEALLPASLTATEQFLFFTAEAPDPLKGRALWKTDGTAPGTGVVKNIGGGKPANNENPRQLTKLGERIIFSAYDRKCGEELWSSDGSEAGTRLLIDLHPGPKGSMPGDLVELNGKIYFTASNGSSGIELWRTDGTKKGTEMADLLPGRVGSTPRELFAADGKLYFYTMTNVEGREIWEFDPDLAPTDSAVVFRK